MFRRERTAALLSAAIALSCAAGARAETADPSTLENLKHQLDTSVERKKTLDAQTDAVRKEADEIRSRLIVTAASVQAREAEVSASEDRLSGLKEAETGLLAELERRRGEMADLLAALTRLDRHPPPALAVRPDDALGAIRSAILLGDAVPELKAEAAALRTRLDELTRLRESILAERATLAQAKASLERDRASLEALLSRKLARQQRLARAAEDEQARGARLAREATDLNDLIGRLESEAAARLPESRPERRPPPAGPAVADQDQPAAKAAPEPSAEDRPAIRSDTQTALLTPPANQPDLPSSRLFSQAKGLIRQPVAGSIVRGFDQPNGLGGKTQGLTIATRPGAQVIAPFDGKIVFAGSFRRYGQLLIISVGEGYHVLLAGMTRINGLAGQSILAGEPVGIMGSSSDEDSPARQTGAADNGGLGAKEVSSGQHPALYIEFRKDGDPIDPRPWLMMSDKKARG